MSMAAKRSTSVEWYTPQYLFDQLDREFHFTLDPCATEESAKCKHYYTIEDNGLSKSWGGEIVFCNPPYGRHIDEWIIKAEHEAEKPNTTVVVLMPSHTDTKYFHDHILGKAEIRFIRGRIKFNEGKEPAPFSSMLAIFRGEENGNHTSSCASYRQEIQ